ncbi:unnamed protein product [Alternaria sp. RS040]
MREHIDTAKEVMIACLRYKKPLTVDYLNQSPYQDLIAVKQAHHEDRSPDPTVYRDPLAAIEKRAIVGATVLVDGLRYRTCPKTSCTAPGQYAKGTKIKLSCFTRTDTTTVNGDK